MLAEQTIQHIVGQFANNRAMLLLAIEVCHNNDPHRLKASELVSITPWRLATF